MGLELAYISHEKNRQFDIRLVFSLRDLLGAERKTCRIKIRCVTRQLLGWAKSLDRGRLTFLFLNRFWLKNTFLGGAI
jgi:hypothetical protein